MAKDKDKDTSKNNFILFFIRKQIQLLNWLTVLTVFVLLLIIVRLSYNFLDYMPMKSLLNVLAITALLCLLSVYLAKLVASKATTAIDDYSKQLNSLISIIDDIREVGYIGILLKNIIWEAIDKAQAHGGSVMLVEGGNVVVKAARGYGEDVRGFSFPVSQGIAGWVVEHRNAVIINDLKNNSIFTPGIDDRAGYDTGSVICVPLKKGLKIIGAIRVDSRDVGAFSAEDEEMLLVYAEHALMSIEKTRHYEDTDNYGVHLTDILVDAVEKLSGKSLR